MKNGKMQSLTKGGITDKRIWMIQYRGKKSTYPRMKKISDLLKFNFTIQRFTSHRIRSRILMYSSKSFIHFESHLIAFSSIHCHTSLQTNKYATHLMFILVVVIVAVIALLGDDDCREKLCKYPRSILSCIHMLMILCNRTKTYNMQIWCVVWCFFSEILNVFTRAMV